MADVITGRTGAQKVATYDALVQTLEDFFEEAGLTIVTPSGTTVSTLAGIISDIFERFDVEQFSDSTAMDADLDHDPGQFAYTQDDDSLYIKTGASGAGSWLPLLADVVQNDDLTAWFDATLATLREAGYVGDIMPPEAGYAWADLDPDTGRLAGALTTDGQYRLAKLSVLSEALLPAGSVLREYLETEIQAVLGEEISSPETDYLWVDRDADTNRVAGYLKSDGVYNLAKLRVSNTLTLPDYLQRQVLPQVSDVVEAEADEFRGVLADIMARTNEGDGSFWVRFPKKKTRLLRGEINPGSNMEFRRSAGIDILGKAYEGSFDPGSTDSTNLRGTITGPSVSDPVGSFSDGDYYQYVNGAGDVSTGTHSGMYPGDLLVYDGSSWGIQAAPGTFGSRPRHGFWIASADGVFDGHELLTGDAIMYLTRQMGGGGPQYERWHVLDYTKGDLAYFGEFDASGGSMPASPTTNAVYQASSDGTAGGYDFTDGDYALWDGVHWYHIENETPVLVDTGDPAALKCNECASEWEFRRTNKIDGELGVRLAGMVQSQVKRSGDNLLLLSDSMFGVNGVGTQILTDSGRSGVVRAYGGATSEQVLGMLEYEIAQLGDRYRDYIGAFWHGQNNQPSSESGFAHVMESSLKMRDFMGARDMKSLFLTILGQRAATWNGSRLVMSQHEQQFAETGNLYALSQWYQKMMPGQNLNTYEALLSAATTDPDPTFPGMTEQEVASTYGIIPWSFFNGSDGFSWEPADLSFSGYHSAAGLPSGGSDLDYYIRTDNGTVGNLLVKESGSWYERSIDITHLSPAGAVALSQGGAGFSSITAREGVATFLNNNLI